MCKDVHCVAAHGGGPPLMAKATGVVASQLQKDADLNGGDFNSRPYYRMFLGLICSLPANDPTDGNAFGMLSALSNTLALVQVSVLQFHVLSGMRACFQIAQAQWPLQRAAVYSTFSCLSACADASCMICRRPASVSPVPCLHTKQHVAAHVSLEAAIMWCCSHCECLGLRLPGWS